MDVYLSSDPNDPNPSDVGQPNQGGTAPVPSPDIQTSPLVSDTTSTQTPPKSLPIQDVLGKFFADDSFQRKSSPFHRAVLDEVMTSLHPEYPNWDTQKKSDFIDALEEAIPNPDPYYKERIASKIYTPVFQGLGSATAEMLPAAWASGTIAPTAGMAIGTAAAHVTDQMLGIRAPIKTVGGFGGEAVRDIGESIVGVMGGKIMKYAFGGVPMDASAKELNDIGNSMGVNIPMEALTPDNPAIGTIASAMRVLPGGRQIAMQADEKVLQQMLKQYKIRLDEGGVDQSLESLGKGVQGWLDDHVTRQGNFNAQEALNYKNAILQQFGSPISYEQFGKSAQKQVAAYQEQINTLANNAHEYARTLYNQDAQVPVGEAAHSLQPLLDDIQKKDVAFRPHKLIEVLNRFLGKDEAEQMVQQRNAEIQAAMQKITGGTLGLTPENFSKLPQAGQDLIKKEYGIPEQYTPEEIKSFLDQRKMPLSAIADLKHEIGNAIGSLDRSYAMGQGPIPGYGSDAAPWKRAYGPIKDILNTEVANQSPAASKALSAADAMTSYMHGQTKKDVLNKILNSQDPEFLYQTIYRPGAMSAPNTVQRAITPELQQQVRARWITDFLNTGMESDGTPKPFTGAFVRKQINDLGTNGPAQINNLMGHKMTTDLHALAGQIDSLSPALPNNSFFKSILASPNGQSVIDAMFRKGGSEQIAMTMNAMDEEGQQLMRQAFLARLMRLSSHGEISGTAMDTAKNMFGQDTLDLMFKTEGEQKRAMNFVELGYRMKKQLASAQNPPNTAMGFMAARITKLMLTNPVQALLQFGQADELAAAYYSDGMQKYLREGITPAVNAITGRANNVLPDFMSIPSATREGVSKIGEMAGRTIPGIFEGGGDDSRRGSKR